MNKARNPFSPGAGTRPPELAGRDDLIRDFKDDIMRMVAGVPAKSQLITGLQGVGKTALLNKIQDLVEEERVVVSHIEADSFEDFNENLALEMRRVLDVFSEMSLSEMSGAAKAKQKCYDALDALARYAKSAKISIGEVSLSLQPSESIRIIGHNVSDMATLLFSIGRAAEALNSAWVLMIDEMHELKEEELIAVVKGFHRAHQKGLPMNAYFAGLNAGATNLYKWKTYSERSFEYNDIDCLDFEATRHALCLPMERQGKSIEEAAVAYIFERTNGYPFFIQEYGFAAWEAADETSVTKEDVVQCEAKVIKRTDRSIFHARMSRLSNAELEFVNAMASLGSGPYQVAKISGQLNRSQKSIGPHRSNLIEKGVIHSRQRGTLEFTVPMFDEFLRRQSRR